MEQRHEISAGEWVWATGAVSAVGIPMGIHLTSQKLWKRKPRAADGFSLMQPQKSGFCQTRGTAELCSAHSIRIWCSVADSSVVILQTSGGQAAPPGKQKSHGSHPAPDLRGLEGQVT